MARTPARDLLEFIPFWLALRTLGLLPAALGEAAGSGLGALAYSLLARRRKVALANLDRVFGAQMDAAARAGIARGSFRSLGRLVADFAQLPRVDRRWVEAHVRYEGWEHYLAAKARGKGVLYLAAHFGSWELIPMAQAALGEPMAFIVRPADNGRIESVIRSYRERLGNAAISKRDALRPCLERLKRGETVGILIDQRVPPERGIATSFLGQPTYTTGALAALALRTGAPVLPVFAVPEGRGRHRIVFESPIEPDTNPDRDACVAATTRRYVAAVERQVRQRPEVWLWAHRRFRDAEDGPRAAANRA
jgi:KDO2-lipid IV(A) lauroyltransferase